MKRFLYIVCLVGAMAAGYWHRTADTVAEQATATPPETAYVSVVNHLGWFATTTDSIAVPTAQTLCQNTHSSHTPASHSHTLVKHAVAQQRQQRAQFVLHLAAATDAVAAHYYIYALRRILR
ncbi:MAG: hypothetical protein ACI392_02195 [Paludibacteraceae bacterium]